MSILRSVVQLVASNWPKGSVLSVFEPDPIPNTAVTVVHLEGCIVDIKYDGKSYWIVCDMMDIDELFSQIDVMSDDG